MRVVRATLIGLSLALRVVSFACDAVAVGLELLATRIRRP